MKIIVIPPYKHTRYRGEGRFIANELLGAMQARGQLEGVHVDIDDGYEIAEEADKHRDEEFLARISLGTLVKVKEYCQRGGYDAIVCEGTMGMGFFGARMIARIPVVTAVHAGLHVAALLGERFSLIEAEDPQALVARHNAQLYGLSDALASVRLVSRSSTELTRFIHQHQKRDRISVPEGKRIVDDIVVCCINAIEEDRIDTLVFGCTPIQCFEEEARAELDQRGYGEIPIVSEFSASIEVAKLMHNLRLSQAPRAYPSHDLKARPRFR